jgi:hypothetical protein
MHDDLVRRAQNQVAPRPMGKAATRRAQNEYDDDLLWFLHKHRMVQAGEELAGEIIDSLGHLNNEARNTVVTNYRVMMGELQQSEASPLIVQQLIGLQASLGNDVQRVINQFTYRVTK